MGKRMAGGEHILSREVKVTCTVDLQAPGESLLFSFIFVYRSV